MTQATLLGPANDDLVIGKQITVPDGLQLTFWSEADLFINEPVTLSGSQTLSFYAGDNLYVNARVSSQHASGKVALKAGQNETATGNNSSYYINAPVDIEAGANFYSKIGYDGSLWTYTVVTELGAAGSRTRADLQGIIDAMGGIYALGADINASITTTWNDGAGFEPFFKPNSTHHFKGRFEGLGHVVDGLYINRPGTDNVGLFGMVQYSGAKTQVSNLGVTNANITGKQFVGGVIGKVSEGNAFNIFSTGQVNGSRWVGGAIGYVVMGYQANHVIKNSYSLADVNCSGSTVGGLIGQSMAQVANSYSTGLVNGSTSAGGLIGSSIKSANGSFWDVNTSSQGTSKGNGVLGKSTAEMKSKSTYTDAGWDFNTSTGMWKIFPNHYPQFRWVLNPNDISWSSLWLEWMPWRMIST